MARFTIIFSLGLLLLTGCLQSKEHLTLNKDGTGTLEVEQLIPSGTIKLVDNMFGGMMKGMSEAFGQEGQEAKVPESMAVEMFANKNQIIKKAEEAGANIEFTSFEHQMKGEDLQVNYTFKFDDINRVLKSELINSKLEFSGDSEGNLVISLKEDPDKAKGAEMQIAQVGSFKQSEDFKKMPSDMQDSIIGGMENFKSELFITLPNEITQVKGVFKQKDPYTVGLEISGNILDPETIKNLYAVAIEPAVVACSREGLSFSIEEAGQSSAIQKYSLGSDIQVYLQNGNVVEGMLMEQNQEYLIVDVMGISLTYYLEEIQRAELLPKQEDQKKEESEL